MLARNLPVSDGMYMSAKTRSVLIASLLIGATSQDGAAQADSARIFKASGNRVTATAGEHYQAGALHRTIFGSGWRDVWATPFQVSTIDLRTHLGGLKFLERGGTSQSIVLHLQEENGWREYRFRSVDKWPSRGISPELKGTEGGRIIQDQVSNYLPAAPVMVPPFMEAIGALHVVPEIYKLEDDPRLGALRDTVVGMLGTFELKGSEAPDDKPGFAGSVKIKKHDKFVEELSSGRDHQLNEREFLAVRLIDMLVGDPDRTPDNFDFARFGEKGAYTWRTIARDRDRAFMNSGGLFNTLVVRRILPKEVSFGPRIPLRGLTYGAHILDRRLLQRLTRQDFEDVSLQVQRQVTDAVIDDAVSRLPREWRVSTSADEKLVTTLRARRDGLHDLALRFYRQLSPEVEVYGTDEPDWIVAERHADGSVTVTVTDPQRPVIAERRADGAVVTTSNGEVTASSRGSGGPYFGRTFLPTETKEVRIHAGKGDDVVVVRGAPSDAIVVRVIGDEGRDQLADSTNASGTYLYDSDGNNRFLSGDDTHISTKPWKELDPESGFRIGGDWKPDFGRSAGFGPAFDYNTGAGVIVGASHQITQYGFRRLPYKWRGAGTFLVGTGNGRVGLKLFSDYRFENSPRALRIQGEATQLEAIRFYGYGNDTPDLDRDVSLVDQRLIKIEPSMVWHVGYRAREGYGNPIRGEDTLPVGALRALVGELRVGAVGGWIDPEPVSISPLTGVRGGNEFGFAGAQVGVELDRTDNDAVPTRGWKLDADVAALPLVGPAFGTASAEGKFYVPLVKDGPHLAFRAGGAVSAGDYPAQFAAVLGGRGSLRGYSWRRFAGDAAANAGAELRVPVGEINLLVRSKVGVFGLADAGRVWFDGDSESGWHTGLGGGLWLSSLGRSVSVAYAHGEAHRFYVKMGMSY